jgi:hypothetical protein
VFLVAMAIHSLVLASCTACLLALSPCPWAAVEVGCPPEQIQMPWNVMLHLCTCVCMCAYVYMHVYTCVHVCVRARTCLLYFVLMPLSPWVSCGHRGKGEKEESWRGRTLRHIHTHTHTHTHTDFELRSQQGKNSTWTFLGARQSRIEEVGIF